MLTASVVLLFLGAMGKSAQFPFHVWLPDAMEGPTPVSALIHAATMVVAGVYLVARTLPLFELVAGGAGAGAGRRPVHDVPVGVPRPRDDRHQARRRLLDDQQPRAHVRRARRRLACGAMLYLFTHAFFKAMLFLGAGSVIHATEQQEVDKLGGLWRKMPITGATFAIGALSMAGLPVLAGFWAKDEILAAALDNHAVVRAAAAHAAGDGALHGARLHPHVPRRAEGRARRRARARVAADDGAAAAAARRARRGRRLRRVRPGRRGARLPGRHRPGDLPRSEPEKLHFDWGIASARRRSSSSALLVAWYSYVVRPGIAGRRRAGARAGLHRLLVNKYYLDDIYQCVIDNVVLGVARLVAWFDRNVVNDTGVNGPAETTGMLAYLAEVPADRQAAELRAGDGRRRSSRWRSWRSR